MKTRSEVPLSKCGSNDVDGVSCFLEGEFGEVEHGVDEKANIFRLQRRLEVESNLGIPGQGLLL